MAQDKALKGVRAFDALRKDGIIKKVGTRSRPAFHTLAGERIAPSIVKHWIEHKVLKVDVDDPNVYRLSVYYGGKA